MKRLFIPCLFFRMLFLAKWEEGDHPKVQNYNVRDQMNDARAVDFAAIDRTGAGERFTQTLFDHTSGAETCTIQCIKTPAGGSSPAGLHTQGGSNFLYPERHNEYRNRGQAV